jgi:hypothetical protein
MKIRHLIATAAIVAWLALPAPALADCQPGGPLAQEVSEAQVVFVGRVMEIGPAARAGNARFQVEDVWVGQLRETVTVYGLSGEQFGEDDRTWQLGARYLVVPIVDGNILRDSICSATTEWQPQLAALRPTSRPEGTDLSQGIPLLVPIAIVAITLAALGAFIGYDWAQKRRLSTGEE